MLMVKTKKILIFKFFIFVEGKAAAAFLNFSVKYYVYTRLLLIRTKRKGHWI